MASGRTGTGIVPKMWERPFWERRLASSGLAGYGAFADSPHVGTLQGMMGRSGSQSQIQEA